MSEISDLIWFIAEWCTANDYKLEDVAQYNIDKLTKHYPDGFSSEKKHKGSLKAPFFISQNEMYITIFYNYIFYFL